ncbi:MAG: PAS domain-containing protein [Alphaproteobacteria bacterium]|nr:PAS domain-containing protein [Alphaproteobacteria bacterium]MBU1517282.1 PAS domain-containing protein [Alphaproteobacteria bacterium]MBU2093182.1 PAS domain-containing protein [Alphaproteobacteria bacterium]MBU2150451.1 PAS domain-containing protein [Alphaproteobacteria bacterium]MBU2305878.1 PAS domain-containing protein [Alphaproteobacteria bacterium]
MTRELSRSSDRERLGAALQAAGLGEFEWDLARGCLSVSTRMAALTGLPAGDIESEGVIVRNAHPDDAAAFVAQRDAALHAGDTFDIRFRFIRPTDQKLIWLRLAGVVTRDAAGAAQRMTGIIEDVSQNHLEEDQRQQLMAELDHRVKNVLAAVQALAQQTAKRTASLPAFLQTFGGRLKAMASANELLTAARWRGAAIDHLAAAELGAIAPGQTSWAGPELFLTPRAANALSLALHELATNAVKFGALSVETGHVALKWTLRPNGGFELTWTESGGPTVTAPARRGFGSTLLEQVTGRELNGETQVDYRPAGVTVRLRAGPQAVAERPEVVPEAPVARVTETVATSRGPASLKGARVLIVEDAVLLALELETGLSEAGATVIGPAYELEEAMALLDQPIDAAVLDANLNGRSVTPVAEALHQRQIPFVFATGYGETGGAPGGFEAPVIRKPYDVTQVAAAVADLLANR